MDEPSYCPLQGGTKERKQKDLVWRKEDDSCPACFTVKHFTRGRRRKKRGKKGEKKERKNQTSELQTNTQHKTGTTEKLSSHSWPLDTIRRQ